MSSTTLELVEVTADGQVTVEVIETSQPVLEVIEEGPPELVEVILEGPPGPPGPEGPPGPDYAGDAPDFVVIFENGLV